MVRPLELQHHSLPGFRGKVADFIEHKYFITVISVLIVINAFTLGLETNDALMRDYGAAFHFFDYLVVGIFTVEILLKLYTYRLPFFKVGWNIFDFVIVAISLMPHAGPFAILRALRILRILRLITLVPQMRNVIGALFHAIPGMASVIGILFIIVYVFSVLGTQFFGGSTDEALQFHFGDVGSSMYTMFQLMTLDDWTDVANPAMELYPWAWAYFIPFIILTSFAVLNLFIGIIVDALNIVKEQDIKAEEEDIRSEIRALGEKIDALQNDLRRGDRDR
jgi:voltage-gated sodium channel